MAKEGQTREHALLARTLGVSQVIVAVSKIDCATGGAWSAERFAEIEGQVRAHLLEVGFLPGAVRFLPVSGLQGANLTAQSPDLAWFGGPPLLEVLDASQIPARPVAKPLRLPVQDVYKVSNVGTVPVGRIESGVLKPGMRVRFAPPVVETTVLSVEMHHTKMPQAGPGDIVGFCVRVADKAVQRGMVCSVADGPDAVQTCARLRAQIIVFDPEGEIRVGYTTTMDVHTAHVSCRLVAIISRLDRAGCVLAEGPDSIRAGDGAIVELEPVNPLVVETFEDCAPLGRFALRDTQKTVAVGIVKAVTKNPVSVVAPSSNQLRPPERSKRLKPPKRVERVRAADQDLVAPKNGERVNDEDEDPVQIPLQKQTPEVRRSSKSRPTTSLNGADHGD
jgi:elongation factor 1-alpha